MNCLRWPGRCDRGFESHLGHGCLVCVCVCVCARARVYSVFVLSCIWVEVLRRADHSSKESYRLCTDPKEKNENLDTVRVRYKRNGYKKI
jgi:hypothetical protein